MKTVVLLVQVAEVNGQGRGVFRYLTEVAEVGMFKHYKTPKQFIDEMQQLYHKQNLACGSSSFRITNVVIS